MANSSDLKISDKDLFDLVRSDFQIVKKKIYLNNGSIGPLPLSTIKSITDFYLRYSETGPDSIVFNSYLEDLKKEVRTRVSDLIESRNDEIIFTQSTTEGINFTTNGIDWRPGDKIMIRNPINEHFSNYLPWIKISNEFKLGLRHFPTTNPEATGDQLVTEFEHIYSKESIRMVTTSHVMYNNCSITPVERIGEIIRQKDNDTIFAIDGAQSVGSLNVGVKNLRCDVLAFPSFKWLCGPMGIGILYVRKKMLEEFTPIFVGSGSGEVATIQKKTISKRNHFINNNNAIRFHSYPEKFHPTFRNFPGLAGLEASLRYVLRIGISNIILRNKFLSSILREGLSKMDLLLLHEAEEEKYRSHMISFSFKKKNNDKINKLNLMLQDKGIILAEREMGERKILRISPHFYNSEEEMTRTLDFIKSIIYNID